MDDSRSAPLDQDRHADPWHDTGRKMAEAIPMIAAAGDGLLRLQASRQRQVAERDLENARQLCAAYDAEVKAAGLVYGRAHDPGWLSGAPPEALRGTWRTAMQWADQDPRAAAARSWRQDRLRPICSGTSCRAAAPR